LLDETVVATSVEAQDDQIADYCEAASFEYTRGSEADVLERYYQTAKEFDADTVVRVTADCPLISPAIIDRLIRIYSESDAEFVSNKKRYTYPNGLQAEVIQFETLKKTWKEATRPEDREHVTRYIRRSGDFAKRTVENQLDTSEYSITDDETVLRWSVDYQSDLEFVREIYDRLYTNGGWTINQLAVFEFLKRNPELVELTSHASPEDFEVN